MKHRYIVIVATVVIFSISLFMMKFIKQEFFPPSLRPEIIVEMTLPEGSSMKASQTEATNMAEFLNRKKDLISNYSYYVGEGSPRFVLTSEPILAKDNYAQFVIVANDIEARKELTKLLREELAVNFLNVRSHIKFISMGPPADYPIMLRVSLRQLLLRSLKLLKFYILRLQVQLLLNSTLAIARLTLI